MRRPLGAVLIYEVLSVRNDRFGASDGHFVAIRVDSFRKNAQVNFFCIRHDFLKMEQ